MPYVPFPQAEENEGQLRINKTDLHDKNEILMIMS
jgi:hypothetical protein